MNISNDFFSRSADIVAKDLLGKVLRFQYDHYFLCVLIIETEAYFLTDKASHSSLGFTEKKRALFMPAGTLYLYYARGKDSLNIKTEGMGNAVLIKSGIPYLDALSHPNMIEIMQKNNPLPNGKIRNPEKLCSGQTLLCKSLGIKVSHWDKKNFIYPHFYLEDIHYYPNKIIHTPRLGISKGRDEHLLYRFVDENYAKFCTKNPLSREKA